MTDTAERPQDARAIANYILDEAPKYDIKDLSLMKLLKLIFLSHGWSFYFCDKPLVDTQPQAWQYGPVYPDVYRVFSGRGSLPIGSDEEIENKETGLPFYAALTPQQQGVIKAVLDSYGPLSAFQLSNITHMPNSPWEETVKRDKGFFGEISADSMRNYYLTAAKERGMKDKTA